MDLVTVAACILFKRIRKIIHALNAVESLNCLIRTSFTIRWSVAIEMAETNLIHPAFRKFEKDERIVRDWFATRCQFTKLFCERSDA